MAASLLIFGFDELHEEALEAGLRMRQAEQAHARIDDGLGDPSPHVSFDAEREALARADAGRSLVDRRDALNARELLLQPFRHAVDVAEKPHALRHRGL